MEAAGCAGWRAPGAHDAIEADTRGVATEREAPDLGRGVGAGDAVRVLEERLAVDGVEDVVRGEVRVHLGLSYED